MCTNPNHSGLYDICDRMADEERARKEVQTERQAAATASTVRTATTIAAAALGWWLAGRKPK
jgi:hypothetical protein